jgi:hypothetical protein
MATAMLKNDTSKQRCCVNNKNVATAIEQRFKASIKMLVNKQAKDL